jgi:hypothetical protein
MERIYDYPFKKSLEWARKVKICVEDFIIRQIEMKRLYN